MSAHTGFERKGGERTVSHRNAYFTVEAALVLPIVMSAMLLEIYLFCFQYDRCLLEQDAGSLLLWSSDAIRNIEETDALKKQMQIRTAEVYADKYVAWDITAMDITLDKNHIKVSGQGSLTFPVPPWNIWNDTNLWETEAVYKSNRQSPVFYIRQYRKLQKLTENNNK